MKKIVAIVALVAVMAISGMAEASLSTIGTADYAGSSYNLIYDNDSSLIWLDYTNTANTWNNQVTWASNLGTTLSNVKLNSGVSVTWNGGWRLPTTVDGPYVFGNNGTTTAGYNITSSELGHLYYTELQNKGYNDINGYPQPGFAGIGFINKGPFANLPNLLLISNYWSGTEFADNTNIAWSFSSEGENSIFDKTFRLSGLANRSGIVTLDATPTPIPAVAWLFGSGLMGLAGVRRRVKK